MFKIHKVIVFICTIVVVASSELNQVPVFYDPSTPFPVKYIQEDNSNGPTIITYSNVPASNSVKINAYQTVTEHPPPTAYKTSSSVPARLVQPVLSYAKSIPKLATYPAEQYPSYSSASANKYVQVLVPRTMRIPVYQQVVNNYAGDGQVIRLVNSAYATETLAPKYLGPPLRSPSPKAIPVPVEYPKVVGKKLGPAIVYTPVDNSIAHKSPPFTPVANDVVQSRYANYVKSGVMYSPATAVSRVNFNGVGVSYEY